MIDAHCHLQDVVLKQDLESIIEIGTSAGIEKWVVNGTCEDDWGRLASLTRQYPQSIMPSFGLHPWYIAKRSQDWQKVLQEYLEEFPAAGVGEIGLDRWIEGYDIEDQIEVFVVQWQLAKELQRPLSVHCLRAWGHLVESLKELPEHPFLLHSYSGSKELIAPFAASHAYFSISGYFLDKAKRHKLEVFHAVPEDRLLVETDAPAMPLPAEKNLYPKAGYNHPGNLEVVYQSVDQELGYSKAQIQSNFERWYGLVLG